MEKVHRLQQPFQVEYQTISGNVVHKKEQKYRIKTRQGLVSAQTAASCLLVPDIGDRVTLIQDDDLYFISVVLTQQNSEISLLSTPGELRVKADRILLEGAESVNLHSKSIGLKSAIANMQFGLLKQLALKFDVVADKLTTTANKIRRTAKQEHTTFEQQIERVTDTKNSQSHRFFQRITKQWISRSERTTITAKKEVKLDGKRIDLG